MLHVFLTNPPLTTFNVWPFSWLDAVRSTHKCPLTPIWTYFTSSHYLINDTITNCIIHQQIIWTMDDSPIYCIWPITNRPNQSISKQEALIMLIIADHWIRLKCLTSFLGMADHSAEHMVNHVAESHGSPHGSSHAPGHMASFWISTAWFRMHATRFRRTSCFFLINHSKTSQ